MDAPSLTAAVRHELLQHPEVTEGAHRFGGIVFHLGRRELGHLHGETVADLPFPPHIHDELVASGRVSPGHGASDTWVSRRVTGPGDVEQIVELFRLSYEYAAAAALEDPDEEDEEATAAAEREGGARWRGILSRALHPMRSRNGSSS